MSKKKRKKKRNRSRVWASFKNWKPERDSQKELKGFGDYKGEISLIPRYDREIQKAVPKSYMKRCVKAVSYWSKKSIQSSHKKSGIKLPFNLYSYLCSYCGCWHITKKKFKGTQLVIRKG